MNSGLRLSEASPARKASRTSFPPARRLSAGRMTWPSLARTGTARPLTRQRGNPVGRRREIERQRRRCVGQREPKDSIRFQRRRRRGRDDEAQLVAKRRHACRARLGERQRDARAGGKRGLQHGEHPDGQQWDQLSFQSPARAGSQPQIGSRIDHRIPDSPSGYAPRSTPTRDHPVSTRRKQNVTGSDHAAAVGMRGADARRQERGTHRQQGRRRLAPRCRHALFDRRLARSRRCCRTRTTRSCSSRRRGRRLPARRRSPSSARRRRRARG